jgi:hypothetical protein
LRISDTTVGSRRLDTPDVHSKPMRASMTPASRARSLLVGVALALGMLATPAHAAGGRSAAEGQPAAGGQASGVSLSGESPSLIAENSASRPPRPPALKLRIKLVHQTLHEILATRTLRAVCVVNLPSTCRVRGPSGRGQATLRTGGRKVITVRLRPRTLRALRRGHKLKITLTATAASRRDHRTVSASTTLVVR